MYTAMTSDISQFKLVKAIAMHDMLANEVGAYLGIVGFMYLVWV